MRSKSRLFLLLLAAFGGTGWQTAEDPSRGTPADARAAGHPKVLPDEIACNLAALRVAEQYFARGWRLKDSVGWRYACTLKLDDAGNAVDFELAGTCDMDGDGRSTVFRAPRDRAPGRVTRPSIQ